MRPMNPGYKSLLALYILHSLATQRPWSFSILTWQWGWVTWSTNHLCPAVWPSTCLQQVMSLVAFSTQHVPGQMSTNTLCSLSHTSRCTCALAVWPKCTFIMETALETCWEEEWHKSRGHGVWCSNDSWQKPLAARSCVNLVHPSLNYFNFSSSGWNFASFYRGYYKPLGRKIIPYKSRK